MQESNIVARLMLTLAAVAVLSAPASGLGKPATGSNCNSNWVNNSGAMDCFIKGEEESHAGAAHPHYVACLAGQIYCCQDDSKGQNCDAVMSVHPVSGADWMRAVLASQKAQAMRMSKMPPPANTTISTPPKRMQ